jgi:hypothetical protein
MHLLKPALLLAAFLLVGVSSMADELTSEATPLSPLVSDQGQGPQEDPSKWSYPPDVTKIDPNCQGMNRETVRVTLDSIFWRIEHGGNHLLFCRRPEVSDSLVEAVTTKRNLALGSGTVTDTQVDAADLAINNLGTAINTAYNAMVPAQYSDQLDLGIKFGPRLSVMLSTDEGGAFEVNYFGIYDWSASSYYAAGTGYQLQVPDSMGDYYPIFHTGYDRNPLVIGMTQAQVNAANTAASAYSANLDPSQDFSQATAMGVSYTIAINSLEANFLYHLPDQPIAAIFGGRFVRLDENFDLTAYDTTQTYTRPSGYHSDYMVKTRNEMFGIQSGVRFDAPVARRVQLEGFAKLGVYNNNARQSTFLSDIDSSYTKRDFATSQAVAAFVGDFNVSANYCLNSNWLVRLGYSAVVLTGVARAPDQLDFTTGTTAAGSTAGRDIHFGDPAWIHGVNVGLEGRF